jgi:DNA (cytosine-5)-methyltransferase 1
MKGGAVANASSRKAKRKPNAISLFSGAGGFCEGVRLAGFRVACAVEADDAACRTHEANFHDVALFEGDICRFLRDKMEGIPSRKQLTEQGIDLVYGGPPCQGFSQIGPRQLNDPRNRLYKEFVRVVRALRPSAFIMENVPNMLAMENGHFRAKILSAFRRAGYSRIAVVPLLASDFGVPQHRRRVFVFGLKDGLDFEQDLAEAVEALVTKQKVQRAVTVREAISDLPARTSQEDKPISYPAWRRRKYSAFQRLMRLDCDTSLLPSALKRANVHPDILHNHHTKGVEAPRRKIIKAVRPGATGDSLPAHIWIGTYCTVRLNGHHRSSKLQVYSLRCTSSWRESRQRYCQISRQEASSCLPPLPETPVEIV